jgi:hypothetical protein
MNLNALIRTYLLSPSPYGLLSVSVFALLCAVLPHEAQATELSAAEIIKKATQSGSVSFQEGQAEIEMEITQASGRVRKNTMVLKMRKSLAGLSQTMVRFEKPAAVKGTSFLVRERKGQLPDQFVFVPATKVVRRIAAGNSTRSFFGSDFSYADLMPMPKEDQEKGKIVRLADATVGGQAAYAIQMELPPEAPYGKVLFYVHQKHLLPIKVSFFDKKDQILKELVMKKLKKIEGQLVPVEMVMKNVQKGSQTVLRVNQIDSKAKLTDADFTEAAMKQ